VGHQTNHLLPIVPKGGLRSQEMADLVIFLEKWEWARPGLLVQGRGRSPIGGFDHAALAV
jgi:hypothetical protein